MISLRYQGRDKVINALNRIADPKQREDLLDNIGSYGVSSTQERFIQRRDPEGQSWKESRRAREEGGQTLRDSNRLFQSLTHKVSGTSVAWGTNLVYASAHQFGAVIVPKNGKKLKFNGVGGGFVFVDKVTIPQRAFLGIDDHDQDEIEHLTESWLGGLLQ